MSMTFNAAFAQVQSWHHERVEVDPFDDSIDRWVLERYAYDPLRKERRHQVVAAFDNESELMAAFTIRHQELEELKSKGIVEAQEHWSGVHLQPGHAQRAKARRLKRRLGGGYG